MPDAMIRRTGRQLCWLSLQLVRCRKAGPIVAVDMPRRRKGDRIRSSMDMSFSNVLSISRNAFGNEKLSPHAWGEKSVA
jgi:hypothetical protein